MGKMQEAFEIYFSKLKEYCQIEFNTYPKVSFDEGINKELIIGEPDNEGYIAWLPRKINKPFDFIPVERGYNFSLNEEIKEYFASYLFLSLAGFFEDLELDFEPVSEFSEIEVTIRRQIENGRYYFPDKDYLLIGSGGDGDDDFITFSTIIVIPNLFVSLLNLKIAR